MVLRGEKMKRKGVLVIWFIRLFKIYEEEVLAFCLSFWTSQFPQKMLSDDIGLEIHIVLFLRITYFRASLVAQWLRIRLPMQGTRVRALVREDPTCRGATKPVRHNYWACALEPVSHNFWAHVLQLLSPRATTAEAGAPRARAPQQEKPPQREACAPQRRVAPTCRS